MSAILMNPTEKYISAICKFLGLDEQDFSQKLVELRDKGWQRWGGGTVEVTVAEILYVAVRILKPEMSFEGGTNCGYSTAHIAQALKDNGKNPSVNMISVDIDQGAINQAESLLWGKDIEFQPRLSDSVKLLKEWNRAEMPSIDFVFIDTSHTYEHTVKEWAVLQPLLNEKAVVLFHDACASDFGVNRFLKEVSDTGQWSVLILDTQINTGLGIVIKR